MVNQLAGLLTGKAMAAYAALPTEDSMEYRKVKIAILRRYQVNEETHRLRFRQDRRKGDESHREWADRLRDHFEKWTKEGDIPLEDLMEQFIQCVPEELTVWIKEKKPTSVRQAAELADTYTLARNGDEKTSTRKANEPIAGQQPQPRADGPPRPLERQEGGAQHGPRRDIRCYHCNGVGHMMAHCPRKREQAAARPRGLFGKSCAWNTESHKYLQRGSIDGKAVQMLIDTGCDRTMVASNVVNQAKVDLKKKVPVLCIHGNTVIYPTATVELQIGEWRRSATVVVAPELPVAVLLGQDLGEPSEQKTEKGLAVVTRSQKQRDDATPDEDRDGKEPRGKESEQEAMAHVPQEEEILGKATEERDPELKATPRELREWQQKDESMERVRDRAQGAAEETDDPVCFYYERGLLYRRWQPDQQDGQVKACQQLVLPKQCRKVVLRLAHAVPMAGHLGVANTKNRLLQRYYWPGIFKDIAEYIRSCGVCQKSNPRQPARAEMIPMPLMTQLFQRIAMDIIGPLPRTQRGNRFILTIVDCATRYPGAVALSSVEAH